jgi:hypothetical protein
VIGDILHNVVGTADAGANERRQTMPCAQIKITVQQEDAAIGRRLVLVIIPRA